MTKKPEIAEPATKIIDGKVFEYYRPGVYVYPTKNKDALVDR